MRKILLLILLMVFTIGAKAQLSLAYFPFQNSLSISSSPEKLIWADARLDVNTFYGNLNPELMGMINLSRSKYVNYYSGLGLKMVFADGFNGSDFISGYSLSLGVRVKPIQKHTNLHLIFELSPYVNKKFSSGILRVYLGVGYCFDFGKKSD